MELVLLLPIVMSLVIVLGALPFWIKKAKHIGLVWEDMNTYGHPKKTAGSGGLIVVGGFVISVLFYVAIKTFLLKGDGTTLSIFALLTTIVIASGIGFIDDILGWAHGGLSAKLRIFLMFFAAIPLMVINAGQSNIDLPLIGIIDTGLLYALLFIPIGIIGATTTYNFLAGFKGLEAGQGIIILSFLSLISYLTGSSWLALIGLCMVAGIIGFYFFNIIPGKVFPGDSLTYAIGALIACMAILGNFEKIAIFIFIPYIIETIFKVRGKLKKYSFGIPKKDGSLDMPYNKIYGIEHAAIWLLKKIKGKALEKDVTYLIFSFQIIICLLSLFIFKGSLF